MTDPSLVEKAALRRCQRELRAEIAASDHADASSAAAEHALDYLAKRSNRTISLFWPLGDEIDTRPLMVALDRLGRAVALPVMQGAGRPLLFRRWCPGDELIKVSFGVREPPPGRELVQPELILLPLLAFDSTGRRLGYGGGFYDRTLQAARKRSHAITAVGLGFASQEVEKVPANATDERLDGMITEHGFVAMPTKG